MSNRDENIERFDAYISNQLSDSERIALEVELAENSDMQAHFDQHQKEVQVIKALGLREEMANIMAAEKRGKGINLRYWLPIGVAAVLTIVLLALPKKAANPEELFQQYFAPYRNAISGREAVGDIDKALNFYDRGDYENAVEAFGQLAPTDTVIFYKSLSHLALEEAKPALSGFRKIGSASLFYESTQWYKALGFLLAGESDSTRFILNRISSKDVNFEEAQTILKAISN